MNKNRTCPPEFIGENRDPRRYPAPNTPPKPKFIDALEITNDSEQYSTPVKKDPKTGLLYSNAEHLVKQSDDYHTAEEERLEGKIDKEIQDRKDAISEETLYRQQQDNLINQRIDEHEEEVDTLEDKVDGNYNIINNILATKMNKIFSDISVLSTDIALTDYLVINAGNTAYRITIEQLQNIVSQKTDYFKGQFPSLEQLQNAYPLGEAGDYAFVGNKETEQYVMYVWDDIDSHWEETTSSQYLGATTFQAFQESLINGTFHIGAIVGNVDIIGGEPILRSILINGQVYQIPSTQLELSDEVVENGYRLGSITIDGNTWNVPNEVTKVKFSPNNKENGKDLGSVAINNDEWNVATPTQVKELENNTKVVNKEFKEFEVGQKISSNKITKENILDASIMSKFYNIHLVGSTLDQFYVGFSWDSDEQKFWVYAVENTTNVLYEDYVEEIDFKSLFDFTTNVEFVIYQIDTDEGTGLLGTWSETQLTAQEVYDTNKPKLVAWNKGTWVGANSKFTPESIYGVIDNRPVLAPNGVYLIKIGMMVINEETYSLSTVFNTFNGCNVTGYEDIIQATISEGYDGSEPISIAAGFYPADNTIQLSASWLAASDNLAETAPFFEIYKIA